MKPYLHKLTMIPETAQERAAMLGWLFAQGGEYTSSEVAMMFHIKRLHAYWTLQRVSRILPIYPDDKSRPYVWRVCSEID